jgi:hypothetical protein
MPVSKAISDLQAIPNIVGDLGLAIAAAQKQLNVDYLDGIKTLAHIAKDVLKPDAGDLRGFLEHLVSVAAPARYQFTETTIAVQLDLAESSAKAASISGGFRSAAVVVNGSFAASSSREYRAGAEVRAVIHAVLPQDNAAVLKTLLAQADKLAIDTTKELPSGLDKDVLEAAKSAAAAIKVG